MEPPKIYVDKEDLIFRVHSWNMRRYGVDRYNASASLTGTLLLEEFMELQEARDIEEQLDAVGDIMFVAIGGIVKSMPYIYNYKDVYNSISPYRVYFNYCNAKFNKLEPGPEQFIMIPWLCLERVVISNETKKLDRSTNNKKANTDKGPDYVRPNFDDWVKFFNSNGITRLCLPNVKELYALL